MPSRSDGQIDVSAYMRVYVRDLIAATAHLSAEERGAYAWLLFHMWVEHGYLDNDPRSLASRAAVPHRRWPAVWARIERFFDPVDGGKFITQKRLAEELEKARAGRKKRASAGSLGGKSSAKRYASTGVDDPQTGEARGSTISANNAESVGPDRALLEQATKQCSTIVHPSSVIRHPDPDPDPDPEIPSGSLPEVAGPPPALSLVPMDPPVVELPLTGGRKVGVTSGQVAKYARLYPGIDVALELEKCREWLLDHPRKMNGTEGGLKTRLTGWFRRAQDDAARRPAAPGNIGRGARQFAAAEPAAFHGKERSDL